MFLNFEPVDDWTLRERAAKVADKLIEYAFAHLTKLDKGNVSGYCFKRMDKRLRELRSSPLQLFLPLSSAPLQLKTTEATRS